MKPLEGMTALLYARVSTDDKGQTTESQLREMKAWCDREGVEILGIFKEEISGADLNRNEWDRLMGRVVRGGVQILLAYSESRISRSTEDMSELKRILRFYGTNIRYVTSSSKPETPEGDLTNYIGVWTAEQERAKLRINTRNGMLTRKLQGIHCGRPLALVFLNRTLDYKSRINENTKVVTIESIFEFARMGCSVDKAATAVGVSRTTLERALRNEGLLSKYKDVQKGECSEGSNVQIEGVEND
jgi:DNA invertase Pin-like site-specific DNA recombinase